MMLLIDHLSAIVVLDVIQVFSAISPALCYDSGSIWDGESEKKERRKRKIMNISLWLRLNDHVSCIQNHICTIPSYIIQHTMDFQILLV